MWNMLKAKILKLQDDVVHFVVVSFLLTLDMF